MIRLPVITSALAGAALFGAAALAQTAAPATTGKSPTSADLEAVQRDIGATEKKLSGLTEQRKALKDQIADLSDRLVDVAARLQAAEQRATATEERLKKLNESEATLTVELARRRESLATLLAGLQQIDRNPPPPIVTNPDDAVAAVRGAMLFSALLPQLRARTMMVTEALSRLETVRQSLARERANLDEELKQLAQSRQEIDALIARKIALSKEAGAAYDDERRRARELARRAASLKELMTALERQRAAEAAKRAQEEQARIEQQTRDAARAEAERRTAALPPPSSLTFAQSRGRLDYPAQGQKVRGYGDDDGFGGASKGLFIATRPEAQVVAPAAGRVEYAGEFRSYGQLLILDVGGGYHVLLAGLGTLSAETGQMVRAGEPLGTMGKEPARSTLIGDLMEDHRPVLYVEFRQNGGAIDPSPWWIGARREARG